jgi:hypothetical protein
MQNDRIRPVWMNLWRYADRVFGINTNIRRGSLPASSGVSFIQIDMVAGASHPAFLARNRPPIHFKRTSDELRDD